MKVKTILANIYFHLAILSILYLVSGCTQNSLENERVNDTSDASGTLSLTIVKQELKEKYSENAGINWDELSGLSKKSETALRTIDSMYISLTSTDNTPVQSWGIKGTNTTVRVDDIYPGTNKLLELWIYDSTGVLIYEGQKNGIEIIQGQEAAVTINSTPIFSNVSFAFQLGAGVDSGVFYLSGSTDVYRAELELVGSELGKFTLDNLKGGYKYAVSCSLFLADGKLKFKELTTDSVLVEKGTAHHFALQLDNVLGKISLTITLPEDPAVSFGVSYTNAVKREPDPTDIIFTEFCADPGTGEGEGEWIEIYNRSIDTLELDSCRIGKSTSTDAPTTWFRLGEGLQLLPGAVLVFGDSNVAVKDEFISNDRFTITNTKSQLMIICNKVTQANTVIDSIAYTSYTSDDADSIFIDDDIVNSLHVDGIGKTFNGNNWCQTELAGDGSLPKATPGEVLSNCP
ncbi:MAG: lamin tail domain-containing protein [Fibrobacteria bacterium]|nr:lamin tail domain-containing protein [Fibrobacteria bacterium]